MSSSGLTASEFEASLDLIGRVYDCVIEPERWPSTLEAIKTLMNGTNAMLYGVDLSSNDIRFFMTSGIAPEWLASMGDYRHDLAELFAAAGDVATRPIERFQVVRQDVPDAVWHANRYVREWATPQGICDLLQATLAQNGRRFAALAVARHDSVGLVTPREVEVMSLLAPHLRRVVAIADLVDVKTVEADLFSAAWNAVGIALFLTDGEAKLVHRNRAADRLLAQADGVTLSHGKLRAADGEASRRLASAIARCRAVSVEPRDPGTGIVLANAAGSKAVAHILPLASGRRRARYAGDAVAAVLVQTSAAEARPDLSLFAEAYGLTRAETALLGRLAAGDDITMAGAALGIAKTTAKTHLARLFAKTGTNRQSILVALANKLVTAPIGDVSRAAV